MSTIWSPPPRPDELYHGFFSNTARKAHKYLKKIGNRYFYTQQQIDGYMNKGKKAVGSGVKAAKSAMKKAGRRAYLAKERAWSNAGGKYYKAAINNAYKANDLYNASASEQRRADRLGMGHHNWYDASKSSMDYDSVATDKAFDMNANLKAYRKSLAGKVDRFTGKIGKDGLRKVRSNNRKKNRKKDRFKPRFVTY